ncbi:MAG: hypothetical protein ACKVP0_20525 [Pirellulaceae bacterium]
MRPRNLTPCIIWLAALAMAAQGFGASALVDACQCQTCECGQQVYEKSCCASDVAHKAEKTCGQSCFQQSAGDCARSVTTLGSCSCRGTELPIPLNPPKYVKTKVDEPVLQAMPIAAHVASSTLTNVRQLETGIRHESPPPRILYCVWRI